MDAREELVRRCALKHLSTVGPLSREGFDELTNAVRDNPDGFINDPEEQAFLEVTKGLERAERTSEDDDLLDETAFRRERTKRFNHLSASCDRALELDEGCADARLLLALVADVQPDDTLGLLLELDHALDDELGPLASSGTDDLWGDVFVRPRLRVRAAIARECLDTARYRMAQHFCQDLLDVSASDELGARLTMALALARLEDEEAFDALDVRFERRGNAWSHLARTILMFKLDRLGAARRALHGFDSLCEGGAYALLRPTYVDTYLPDRPSFAPGSFDEATLATHEADPIVVDVPDFVAWAARQPGITESASSFAEANGYDF
jgi:hypothetical protein